MANGKEKRKGASLCRESMSVGTLVGDQPTTLTTEEENPARLQLWLATTQAQGSQGSPYGRA